MKHEKEIDALFKELFSDMPKGIFTEALKQKLSDDIEVGIKNGYSLEKQIEIYKKITT